MILTTSQFVALPVALEVCGMILGLGLKIAKIRGLNELVLNKWKTVYYILIFSPFVLLFIGMILCGLNLIYVKFG